jgi:hypothetical protein
VVNMVNPGHESTKVGSFGDGDHTCSFYFIEAIMVILGDG